MQGSQGCSEQKNSAPEATVTNLANLLENHVKELVSIDFLKVPTALLFGRISAKPELVDAEACDAIVER